MRIDEVITIFIWNWNMKKDGTKILLQTFSIPSAYYDEGQQTIRAYMHGDLYCLKAIGRHRTCLCNGPHWAVSTSMDDALRGGMTQRCFLRSKRIEPSSTNWTLIPAVLRHRQPHRGADFLKHMITLGSNMILNADRICLFYMGMPNCLLDLWSGKDTWIEASVPIMLDLSNGSTYILFENETVKEGATNLYEKRDNAGQLAFIK